MSFRVENRVGIKTPSDRIWDLIADLPGWSAWNPTFPEAEGLIAIGGVLSLTERIDGLPDRRARVTINDWVPYAQLVWSEKRGFQFTSTRYIEIEELAPGSCIVANGEIFGGMFGESYFNKNKRLLRRACEELGEALRAKAEGVGSES